MQISVIASGSNGNCCHIEHGNTSILIDAGKSGKEINKRMQNLGKNLDDVQAILVTHGHADHILGAGVLSRRLDIPLYMTKETYRESQFQLGRIQKKIFSMEKTFTINDLTIQPVRTAHDEGSCGFVIDRFGYFTDTGIVTKQMKKIMPKLHSILLESNYDAEMVKNGPYPYPLKQRILSDQGHLSNEHASVSIQNDCNGLSLALLGHLSGINNTKEIAKETFESIVSKKVEMTVCSRDKETGTWNV